MQQLLPIIMRIGLAVFAALVVLQLAAFKTKVVVITTIASRSSQNAAAVRLGKTHTLLGLPRDANRRSAETQPQEGLSPQDALHRCMPRSDSRRTRRCKT